MSLGIGSIVIGGGGGGGSSQAIVSDTAPQNATAGTRWINPVQARAYEFIDGTWVELSGGEGAALAINTVSTSAYTLTLADAYALVNVTTGATITVPPNSSAAFPVGCQVLVYRSAASNVNVVAGAGVTVSAAGSASNLSSQHSVASLIKIGTDSWILSGDIF